jgi:hypothetical protein
VTKDLLHLIESAKGIETRDLFNEISVSRDNGLWPHKTPVDLQGLQLVLFGLQAAGQVVLVAGSGWWLEGQRPKVKPGARNLPVALFE